MDTISLATQYPTPFYAYDAGIIRARVASLSDAFKGQNVSFHYAVKANDNPAIIKLAADAGIGACLVSAGEMRRALSAGIAPANMLMNGVAKSDDDIRFALQNGIGQLNVESLPELTIIASIARELGVTAPIGLRINPNVAAESTHTNITTGRKTDKFGILIEDLDEAKRIIASCPELNWVGLSCHIGSQIMDPAELANGYRVMVDLCKAQSGLDRLDLGGGFGVSYKGDAYASPADFAKIIAEMTAELQASGIRIQLEPGRYIVAEAGVLVTSIVHVKDSGGLRFVMVDAGMNDLLRPAMYDAYHPINAANNTSVAQRECIVVGPICESSDRFRSDALLPDNIKRGDILNIGFAGAYGYTMSSRYNARATLAEVLVENGKARLIRRPMTADEFDDLTLQG